MLLQKNISKKTKCWNWRWSPRRAARTPDGKNDFWICFWFPAGHSYLFIHSGERRDLNFFRLCYEVSVFVCCWLNQSEGLSIINHQSSIINRPDQRTNQSSDNNSLLSIETTIRHSPGKQHSSITTTSNTYDCFLTMGSSRPRPKRNSSRINSSSSSEINTSSTTTAMDAALATLQPLRDLSRNWDVDVASW